MRANSTEQSPTQAQRPTLADALSRFQSVCYTGYQAIEGSQFYLGRLNNQTQRYEGIDYRLPKHMRDWFANQNWSKAYSQWQQSRQCQSPLIQATPELYPLCQDTVNHQPRASICQNEQDSVDLFHLNRHLLDSAKTLWPGWMELFVGWEKFPSFADDAEETEQWDISPWPDRVIEDAMLVDRLGMMDHQELLSRWPSEEAFLHWLHCGADGPGLSPDALYYSLLFNNGPSELPPHPNAPQNVNDVLFWRAIGWLDNAWTRYRMRIGLTPYEPELQATIIAQCESFEFWAQNQANSNLQLRNDQGTNHDTLFNNGILNVDRLGSRAKLLGEIIDLERSEEGHQLLQINVRRHGVKDLWLISFAKLNPDHFNVGERYYFYGYIAKSQMLPNALRGKVTAETLFVVESAETPK